MEEVLRTNDPVLLSFAQSVLKDAGIEALIFDTHSSAIEGTISAIQRRLMVIDDDADSARRILKDADLIEGG
ncbi:MAG: DUF2007 domain-containing protein [Alphaproteobacteria bacterium]